MVQSSICNSTPISQTASEQNRHSATTEIDEEAIVAFEPYVLIEGVLAKSKTKRDFFLARPFGNKRTKDKWVRRYFRLRCKDPEVYFLEQFADDTSKSKVRRVLELDRVTKVSTNLKNGTKNWIFSVFFSARPDRTPKDSKLHLAADSEEEMSQWVAKLCFAGKLKREGSDEPSALPSPTSPYAGSFDSFAKFSSSERDFTVDKNCSTTTTAGYTLLKHCSSGTDTPCRISSDRRFASEDTCSTNQPYIHLKNCVSFRPAQGNADSPTHQRNQSFGSSSASSSQFSFSSDTDCPSTEVSLRSPIDLLPPPPRPPKMKPNLQPINNTKHEDSMETYSNDPCLLYQPLPPPDLSEIGLDNHGWSGETIKPLSDDEKSPYMLDLSQPAFFVLGNIIPPKVDRSCKPRKKENISGSDEPKKLPPRQRNSSPPNPILPKPALPVKPKFSVPLIPRTNPLNRIQRDVVRNESLSTDENSFVDNALKQPTAEYLDPVVNLTDLSLDSPDSTTPIATSCNTKTSQVEYAVIDEASTQAIIKLQEEQRKNAFSR